MSKARPSAPLVPEPALDLQRDLLLGHAGADELEQVGEAGIGQGARAADGVDLVRGLDDPHRDELGVKGVKLDPRRRLGQGRPIGMRDRRRLHAQRLDPVLEEERRQLLLDRPRRWHERPVGCLVRRLLGVARVGEDQGGIAR